jgi:hypothetical protein
MPFKPALVRLPSTCRIQQAHNSIYHVEIFYKSAFKKSHDTYPAARKGKNISGIQPALRPTALTFLLLKIIKARE